MAKPEYKDKGFKGDSKDNKQYIYNALIENGFTPEAAAGVLGNILHETGNFKYIEELAPNVNNQRGLGLLQWSGSRATDFKKWLKSNDKSIDSVEDNVEYLLYEMGNTEKRHWGRGYSLDKLKNTKDAKKASDLFMNGYLRPSKKYSHQDVRIANSLQALNDFGGADAPDPKQSEVINAIKKKDNTTTTYAQREKALIDTSLSKVDFSQSTLTQEDFERLEAQGKKYLKNLDDSKLLGESGFHEILQRTIGDTAIEPDITTEATEAPQESPYAFLEDVEGDYNPFALGGFTQPNGRVSTYKREEDLIAQEHTGTNQFEEGGKFGEFMKEGGGSAIGGLASIAGMGMSNMQATEYQKPGGSAAKGAIAGAAAGAALGPIGAAAGLVVGGLTSFLTAKKRNKELSIEASNEGAISTIDAQRVNPLGFGGTVNSFVNGGPLGGKKYSTKADAPEGTSFQTDPNKKLSKYQNEEEIIEEERDSKEKLVTFLRSKKGPDEEVDTDAMLSKVQSNLKPSSKYSVVDNNGLDNAFIRKPNEKDLKLKTTKADAIEAKRIDKGAKGDDVVLLQEMLIEQGFLNDEYGADGKFGKNTKEAVKAYQASKGLKADGIVGEKTLGAMQGKNVGMTKFPDLEEKKVEEEVVKKDIDTSNLRDINTDLEESLFTTVKKMAVPIVVRQYIHDTFGGEDTITEKDLNAKEIEAVRKVVKEQLLKEKRTVSYGDWRRAGATGGSVITDDLNFYNPATSMQKTLGSAGIKIDANGSVFLIDEYNWNDAGDKKNRYKNKNMTKEGYLPISDSSSIGNLIYRVARNYKTKFGRSEGEGGSKSLIYIGNIKDLT